MNSISRSLRGILILVVAVAVGTFVLSKTVKTGTTSSSTVPAESTFPTTIAAPVTTASIRDPKTVKVLVANGSRVTGSARRARNCLINAFNVVAPTDTKTKPLPSAIYVQPGFEVEAQQVASALGADVVATPMPASLPVSATLAEGINVIVVIGTDLATSIKNLPCAEAPTASPTAALPSTTLLPA